MAALKKHTTVYAFLRHNTREYPAGKGPQNIDIDSTRTHLNYTLHPSNRGTNPKCHSDSLKYYHTRMKDVYKMNRKDTVASAEWCITAPKDLPVEEQAAFFQSSYEYLNSLYSEKNCIQCIVHYDEGISINDVIVEGSPHMHYSFIKTKEINSENLYFDKLKSITEKYKDDNHEFQKAKKRLDDSNKYKFNEKLDFQGINKKHLDCFHSNFQNWIDNDSKISKATVSSGVTGKKNKTVSTLKQETREKEMLKFKEQIIELKLENKLLKNSSIVKESEHIKNLEIQLSKEKDFSKSLETKIGEIELSSAELWEKLSNESEKNQILKSELDMERSKNQLLEKEIKEKNMELEKEKSKELTNTWGSNSGWGSDNNTKDKEEDFTW